ncbi:hypothetical protein ZWY2020_043983 [Hordeum vulgare]|nr:hypothetical protein ZWY2020_043983 [Hordeum vulgare]
MEAPPDSSVAPAAPPASSLPPPVAPPPASASATPAPAPSLLPPPAPAVGSVAPAVSGKRRRAGQQVVLPQPVPAVAFVAPAAATPKVPKLVRADALLSAPAPSFLGAMRLLMVLTICRFSCPLFSGGLLSFELP